MSLQMLGKLNQSKLHYLQCLSQTIAFKQHLKQHPLYIFHAKRLLCSSYNNMKLGNLYARLGLIGTATQGDIKTAYFKLSKLYHPDKNAGCANAASKFRSITEAYEILGNPLTRAKYDRETPYANTVRRTSAYQQRPTYQSKSEFRNEQDKDFEAEIRFYQQHMRQKAQQPRYTYYGYGPRKVFNFDMWYKAHFYEQYYDMDETQQEQAKRKAEQEFQWRREEKRRQEFRKRPPKIYEEEKPRTDNEMWAMQKQQSDEIKDIFNSLALGTCILLIFISFGYIINEHNDSVEKQFQKRNGES